MRSFLEYRGRTDEWAEYGYAMDPAYNAHGQYLGMAYRFNEHRRPMVGEPVKCWQGAVQRITWVRAHRRTWRVKTEDGVLRTVVEFPTSFIWSQIA